MSKKVGNKSEQRVTGLIRREVKNPTTVKRSTGEGRRAESKKTDNQGERCCRNGGEAKTNRDASATVLRRRERTAVKRRTVKRRVISKDTNNEEELGCRNGGEAKINREGSATSLKRRNAQLGVGVKKEEGMTARTEEKRK